MSVTICSLAAIPSRCTPRTCPSYEGRDETLVGNARRWAAEFYRSSAQNQGTES